MLKGIYDFFSSVKLAIVLLISLAVTSIAGTVIEQQKDPSIYLREYGETAYRLIKFFGLTDVYHSWWYETLLVLLAINITICSVRRLPGIWKAVFDVQKRFPRKAEKSMRILKTAVLEGSLGDAVDSLVKTLKDLGYSAEVTFKEEGEVHVFADKNAYARFGVYIVHLGVLIVLVGGFITAMWGYKGYMNLAPGTESNIVMKFTGGKWRVLPFTVRCNDFEIETYPSGMPKAYRADLSVMEGGLETARKTIKVNDPLKYRGVYFYQASWDRYVVYMTFKDSHGFKRTIKVASGQPIVIKEKDGRLEVLGTVDDGSLSRKYLFIPIVAEIKSRSGRLLGIDTGIEILNQDGKTVSNFRVIPGKSYPLPGSGLSFSMKVFYQLNTGLQVSKDPGTWIVWIGSTVLVLGLVVAFFVFHTRIWARVEDEGDGRVRVTVGGTAVKGAEKLSREIDEVLTFGEEEG